MIDNYEVFVRWYLRFNGYFTIENFIVHGADIEPFRGEYVTAKTEVDTIAIRLPHSLEETGPVPIRNDPELVLDGGCFDVLVAEVKSGENTAPNKVWRDPGKLDSIAYLVRFIGLHKTEDEIRSIATALQENYKCEAENGRIRYRYFVFAHEPHPKFSKQIRYFRFRDAVRFITETRGGCYEEAKCGVRSIHDQWHPLIKKMFEIANDRELSANERVSRVMALLASPH